MNGYKYRSFVYEPVAHSSDLVVMLVVGVVVLVVGDHLGPLVQ